MYGIVCEVQFPNARRMLRVFDDETQIETWRNMGASIKVIRKL